MGRATKAENEAAKSFLWMRKKREKIVQEAEALKRHQRMQQRYADLMAASEKNAVRVARNIVESKRIYEKHKASAQKNTIAAENCLIRFVLNTHPTLVVSDVSKRIMECLDSDSLKCLKQTNKSMCLHVDENCTMTRTFYYRNWRSDRALEKTTLSLV